MITEDEDSNYEKEEGEEGEQRRRR